ncbi:unnamed protein product [Owenia fusiformis]|uniref:Non-structural maintenance of chromosomes element 4 n=1 Tax=Owenia fusiformis TaxID=6347 RepID=A0A8S4NQU2_OWEFU|nr:unnamed protein product [Owenia fusiformis]
MVLLKGNQTSNKDSNVAASTSDTNNKGKGMPKRPSKTVKFDKPEMNEQDSEDDHSSSDEPSSPGGGGDGDPNDPSKRRDIRNEYRTLQNNMNEFQDDMVQPGNKKLEKTLDKVEANFKKVNHTREAAMDGETVVLLTKLAKQRAQNLSTDFVKFSCVEFMEKLLTKITNGQREDTEVTPEMWQNFGENTHQLYRKSPAFSCMLGTFKNDPPERPPPKVPKVKDTDRNKAAVKPTAVKDAGKEITSEDQTSAHVEYINRCLKKEYAEGDNEPVCFFEFVVNPHSFGLTVENIFHLSFLVKDGLAEVKLDEDKLPVIVPLREGGEKGSKKGSKKNSQVLMSITMDEWKKIIKVFDISEPLIEPYVPKKK